MREQLLADMLRLENKQLEESKPLWLLTTAMDGDEHVLILEALSGPGAVAVADTWDLLPDAYSAVDLGISGPHARETWPKKWWYRWLNESDVERMEAEIGEPDL